MSPCDATLWLFLDGFLALTQDMQEDMDLDRDRDRARARDRDGDMDMHRGT